MASQFPESSASAPSIQTAGPGADRWFTFLGKIDYSELRAQARESIGIALTDDRHPADPGEQLPVVSLKELRRGPYVVFPRPARLRKPREPGRYHPAALNLLAFLVASLGLRYPDEDPRRAGWRSEKRAQVHDHLVEQWADLYRRYARPAEAHVDNLRREVRKHDSAETKKVLLRNGAEALEDLHQALATVEDFFYDRLGTQARQAAELTEWPARKPIEILDGEIVRDAATAYRLAARRPAWDSIDWTVWDVVVSYCVTRDANGDLRVAEHPSVRRRRRP